MRRILPGRLLNWYRRRRYSRSRNNLIVMLPRDEDLSDWLRDTPATHRFARYEPSTAHHRSADDVETVVNGSDEADRAEAIAAMASTGALVAVVAEVERPPRHAWGERDLSVSPRAVAIDRSALAGLGGALDAESAKTLYRRTWDAGIEIAVAARPVESTRSASRDDPIDSPCVIILSAVPMHDVGGGSRSAQLAVAMIGAGAHVAHVSFFPSYESGDLGLRFVHPELEQYREDEFEPGQFIGRTDPGWVLVEAPIPEAIAMALRLADHGWNVCYDIIDNWSDPNLGADWYGEKSESRLIGASDLVVVSAADLGERAEARGVDALLVPNAVDSTLFGGVPGSRPDDLPTGRLIGYHGSLYGDWLDWEALERIAHANADAQLVIIGDASRGHPTLPGNVRFLGLKPQHDLPAYISRFAVGLVPFRVNETTHAVSPLKVYEYLACGVPVATPPLRPLKGLEGVYEEEDLVDAVSRALGAPRPDSRTVLVHHSWDARVRVLFDAMGLEHDPRHSSQGLSRVVRKPVRYPNERRVLGSVPHQAGR